MKNMLLMQLYIFLIIQNMAGDQKGYLLGNYPAYLPLFQADSFL